jgi:prevent-host-death family protein
MSKSKKPTTPRRSFTIAEARNNLSRLVRRSEELGPIGLTRRGQPVAVVLSQAEYDRLSAQDAQGPSFPEWVRQWREKYKDVIDSENLGKVFENVRDRSPGRDGPIFT